MSIYRVTTVGGHCLPEAVSAFQKSVRRGQVDDALYWGVDMYMTGYHEYAWKRMKIMCSEDIGPANPTLPAVIHALYQSFVEQHKKKDFANAPERLFFCHAIVLLAQSPKSRIIDHALLHHFLKHTTAKRAIPDYALDKHTQRGKKMGRGIEHFFDEGIKLDREVGDDPYRDLARAAMIKPDPTGPGNGNLWNGPEVLPDDDGQ